MLSLFSDRYTEEHRQFAEVLEQSYQTRDNRQPVSVNGVSYQYFPELSTDFYGHWENDTRILIAVHGAFTVEENIVAIQQSVSVGGENQVVEAFCNKYESLLHVTKQVLMLGHSLGCFAIGQCALRFNKDFDTLMLAPYVPRPFGRYVTKIRTTRIWKKILYNTDWLANNTIKENPQLTNVNVFRNNCLFCFNFLNSHSMQNYRKSPNEVNRDLFSYFP